MAQKFLNNFDSVFVASVKDTPGTGTPATELDYGILRLSDGAAAFLTNPTGGDFYVLTAFKREGTTETNREIMRVTAVDNSTTGECRVTVQRGQEGTSVKAYLSGDYVSLRLTAGAVNNWVAQFDIAKNNADTATNQANIATDKANIATNQANIATDKANIATNQAGIATDKANIATNQAAAAAASYDSFDDRYLGSKSADPTLDNDGNALIEGALYWNSTAKEMRTWNGTAWVTTSAANAVSRGGDTMTGPLSVPAGATGAQVPQRSEVVGIAGTETITGAKTFSVSPIVPAGQTGDGPARANEVARLAAANTFTARQAIADPADQGQMAATAQGRGGLEIRANAGMAAIALHRINAYFAYLGLDTDNALAIGGGSFGDARRRIYHEGNILGTVGAPGGIPNGGIFERGNNANGQYIRYADGTQICWHALATVAGGTNWVYPVAFASTPVTVANEQDTNTTRLYLANPTTGSTTLRAFEVSVSAFSAGNARVIAIGRWF